MGSAADSTQFQAPSISLGSSITDWIDGNKWLVFFLGIKLCYSIQYELRLIIESSVMSLVLGINYKLIEQSIKHWVELSDINVIMEL